MGAAAVSSLRVPREKRPKKKTKDFTKKVQLQNYLIITQNPLKKDKKSTCEPAGDGRTTMDATGGTCRVSPSFITRVITRAAT